ncbi:hypothetical protein ACFOET_19855 [Parapedobacter deserti]|uniref:Uncharacterized protein n=1 Tax=Parapedobacter deserti TaxID=1912957 RepID=A0ABV7JPF1_9SPHI
MKIALRDLQKEVKDIDFFICSAGFEERSTVVAKHLNLSDIRHKAVFHINNSYQLSEENLKAIQALGGFKTINYSKNEPILTYDAIYDFLESIEHNKIVNVLLDVTTFTREVLLIMLKIFESEKMKSKYSVSFIYTPASEYEHSEDFSERWLTKGVREIRSIFGYSGLHTPSKKLMLIVLAGLEDERTEIIIESFEPNALLIGRPSLSSSNHPKLDEKAGYTIKRFKAKFPSFLNEFQFSCNSIRDTQCAIEVLCNNYGKEYNICIAPLNNKVSTLGVAKACINNENIQVCYASANQYNINGYSKPSDYIIYFPTEIQ